MEYLFISLILLLLAVLWFMPAREGLANPTLSGKWAVNSTNYSATITQTGDTWTLTPESTSSGWSLVTGKFNPGSSTSGTMAYTTPSGPLNMTFTLDSTGNTITGSNGGSFTRVAAPATPGCPTKGEGIKSVGQSGGFNVRLYTKGECSAIGGNFAGNGQSTWGMANNDVGECMGTPGGANASFCNVEAPASAEASAAVAGSAGPAPAAPSPGCPTKGEGIKSVNQSGGFNVRLYTKDECSGMGGNFSGNGQSTWGMANNEVGECLGTPGGANASFCNVEAPPSAVASAAVAGSAGPAPAPSATAGCPTAGEGITSVKQTGGLNVRLYTKGECTSLGGNFAGNGQSTWGMANNDVGECLGTPGGTNISFCNQTAPPSAAANAVANPAPVVPTGSPPPPPTNERQRPSWAPQTPALPPPSNHQWAPPGNPPPPAMFPTGPAVRSGPPAPPGSMNYAPYTLSATATSPLGPGPEYVSKNELVPCQCMKPTCNKEHFTD